MDPKTQLELFSRAVALIGGNTATARELGMSERSVRFLLDGTRRPHAGILEDMAKALIRRADECRALERQLSPAFAGNLTELQAKRPLHSGKAPKLLDRLGRDLDKARAAGKTPESLLFGHSFYDRLVDEVGHQLDGREIFGLPWEATKDENVHDRGYAIETAED